MMLLRGVVVFLLLACAVIAQEQDQDRIHFDIPTHNGAALRNQGVIGARERGELLHVISPDINGRSNALDIGFSNLQFTNKLYEILAVQEGNMIFSPLSIHSILTMVYAGTGTSLAEEMKRSLYLPPNKSSSLNGYKTLTKMLSKRKSGVTLYVANKIYTNKGVQIKRSYLNETRPVFQMEVAGIDFSREEESRRTINEWAASKTLQHVTNVIPEGILNSNTNMVLVNAVYFKGNWLTMFEEKNTRADSFTTHANGKIRVPFMNTISEFKYKDNYQEKYKVLELPYEDNKVSMMIVLPYEHNGLPALEQKMRRTNITSLFGGMSSVNVEVALPKFTFEQSIDLNQPLNRMGMVGMFKPGADFSNLLKDENVRVRVSQVAHKAFIEVNEVGTKAAAVTYVAVQTLSINTYPKVYFEAKHPFIFIVRHRETENILFMGRYSHPPAV